MKKKLFVFGILAFAVLASAGVAHAVHYTSIINSVDDHEIRWNGGTAYRDQFNASVNTWNAMRRVNIAPDTLFTIEDLIVGDVNRSDVPWSGIYAWFPGIADTLLMNRWYLLNATNSHRQTVITHELGHALGLDHSTFGNVMFTGVWDQTVLGPQDISDYRFLWGN